MKRDLLCPCKRHVSVVLVYLRKWNIIEQLDCSFCKHIVNKGNKVNFVLQLFTERSGCESRFLNARLCSSHAEVQGNLFNTGKEDATSRHCLCCQKNIVSSAVL